MMRSLIVLCTLFTGLNTNAQDISHEVFPPSEKIAWDKLENNINVSFASSDMRFDKKHVPQLSGTDEWKTVSWKGEKIHSQILIWTNKNIKQVRLHVSDLVNADGARIAAENIHK